MSENDRDLDLNATMALTQRLLGPGKDAREPVDASEGTGPGLGQNLRYWMWRAGGRKRTQPKDTSHILRLLDNYEIELERLRDSHSRDILAQKQAHDRLVTEIEAAHRQSIGGLRAEIIAEAEAGTERLRHELGRERQRIVQLEHLVAEFQRVYQGELVKARAVGRAEGQSALDAAHDQITVLEEELGAQHRRHAEELRTRLEDEAGKADAVLSALRAELETTRQDAATALAQARRDWQEQAAAERTALSQRLEQAEQDKAQALDQAGRAHDAAIGALRTRHAEDMAELRTAGEWSLSDAKRQIADLRLRLNEQDEAHAEELDILHQQHKLELAQWLERFEQAQAHQEIRHAGEYAGSSQALNQALTETREQLEQVRQTLAEQSERRGIVEARNAQLAEQLRLARQAEDDLRVHYQAEQADIRDAAALERRQLSEQLEQEREDAAANAQRVEHLEAELASIRRHADAASAVERQNLFEQLAQEREASATNTLRVERLEAELARARQYADENQSLAQQLTQEREAFVASSLRAERLEAELVTARQHADESQSLAQQLAQERDASAASNLRIEQLEAELASARQGGIDAAEWQNLTAQLEQERDAHARQIIQWKDELDATRKIAEAADLRAAQLAADLETSRRYTVRAEESERENLTQQLEHERAAHSRLLIQWQDELAAARKAAEAANGRAESVGAALDAERQNNTKELANLRSELQSLRDKAAAQARAESGERSTLQQVEWDRLIEDHNLALARLRLDNSRRIAELERQLAQARNQPPPAAPAVTEMAKPPEPAKPASDWQTRLQSAQDRADRAEADALLAANKIEVLKDALALAKARSGGPGTVPVMDNRFRDAKRAFARAFHPDQGGRDQPEKAALFLEFWPVLDKIDKDED